MAHNEMNISATRKGNILTLSIDLTGKVGRTKNDNGNVVAATGGYIPVDKDGETVGMLSLHMWSRDPKKVAVKQRRAFAL